jgi:transposase
VGFSRDVSRDLSSALATRRHELTEQQWQMIKSMVPPETGGRGPRRSSNRVMINAMLWVLHTGAPWRDVPKQYGSWKSVHTRFLRWSKRGIWKGLLDELALDADGEFAMLDASIVRVHQDAVGGKKTEARPSGSPAADPRPRFMLSWTVSATPRRSSLVRDRSKM